MNAFTFDWDAPLTPADRDRLLQQMAVGIVRRGVGLPVQWLLEVHRPLVYVAGQLSITLSPMLAALFVGGAEEMQRYTKLMQDRTNVDALIALIDEKSQEAAIAPR